jgi:mannosyltransferase
MKIILDNIIFSLQKVGGISVVWMELLRKLVNSDLNYTCLEYNGCEDNIFRKTFEISRKRIIKKHYFIINIQRYLNIKRFNLKINYDKPFIFHSSYYRYCTHKKAINFTTVHDFIYEYFSSGIKKVIHCRQKHKAIKKSKYIICISETTKRDLLKFVKGIDEKNIYVIYNGVSDDYYVINKNEYMSSYGDYMIYVGSRTGYKNFNLAVFAAQKTNLNLVIVGSKLTRKENIFLEKELGRERFFSLNKVSNKELNLLYNKAYCLLYPSLYEGFGIPVLEAQKAGCPVVIIDTPSVIEIIGDTPLIAKNDINSIVEKIKLLTDRSIKQKVIKSGLLNASKYSWDKMAEQIISLYNQALNN